MKLPKNISNDDIIQYIKDNLPHFLFITTPPFLYHNQHPKVANKIKKQYYMLHLRAIGIY